MAIDQTTGATIPDVTNTPAVAAQPQIPIYQAPTYTPGQNFQFDPNQYLPGIQNQAASIYNPQQAQIEALQKLQTSQTEKAKITTKEDFAKEMTRRIEAINARGAFFGGGAIDQQNDISTRETRALNDITTQDQAAQAGFLAQKAGLSAEQAKYIQDQLSGAQNSVYGMWKDQYGMYQDQLDREDAQKKFEYQKQQDKLDYELRQRALDDAKYGAGYSGSDNKTQAKMRAKANKKKKK